MTDWKTIPCRIWTGAKSKAGYGQVRRKGILLYVHRFEWEKHHSPLADGECVCHHCDNPSCYEISHLFKGTQKDNVQDAIRKGRWKNPPRRNRSACERGHDFVPGSFRLRSKPNGQIGRVCIECVRLRNKSRPNRDKTSNTYYLHKITRADITVIIEALRDGESQRSLASRFAVNQATISRIKNGGYKTFDRTKLDMKSPIR